MWSPTLRMVREGWGTPVPADWKGGPLALPALRDGGFCGDGSPGCVRGGGFVDPQVSKARHSPQRRGPVSYPIKQRPLVGDPEFAGVPETWGARILGTLDVGHPPSSFQLWRRRMEGSGLPPFAWCAKGGVLRFLLIGTEGRPAGGESPTLRAFRPKTHYHFSSCPKSVPK